jgi:hypothetical protein
MLISGQKICALRDKKKIYSNSRVVRKKPNIASISVHNKNVDIKFSVHNKNADIKFSVHNKNVDIKFSAPDAFLE